MKTLGTINERNGNMKIKYKDRIYIDKYRCIDTIKEINAIRTFQSGGLLYVYKDRYNIMTISKEDVIEIERI